jgi:hypothetical protein
MKLAEVKWKRNAFHQTSKRLLLMLFLFAPEQAVQTESACPRREEDQTSPKHAYVLHEHDHLDLVGKIAVKDERRGNQEDEKQERPKPGKISQDHRGAADQFKKNGAHKKEIGVRHAITGHVLCRSLEIFNLPNSGLEKDEHKKNPSDQHGKSL